MFKFPFDRPDSDTVREMAEGEDFDETSIVYIGRYIGYKDAPNLPDQAAQNARDAIEDNFEREYGIPVEAISAEEQEEILEERGMS